MIDDGIRQLARVVATSGDLDPSRRLLQRLLRCEGSFEAVLDRHEVRSIHPTALAEAAADAFPTYVIEDDAYVPELPVWGDGSVRGRVPEDRLASLRAWEARTISEERGRSIRQRCPFVAHRSWFVLRAPHSSNRVAVVIVLLSMRGGALVFRMNCTADYARGRSFFDLLYEFMSRVAPRWLAGNAHLRMARLNELVPRLNAWNRPDLSPTDRDRRNLATEAFIDFIYTIETEIRNEQG